MLLQGREWMFASGAGSSRVRRPPQPRSRGDEAVSHWAQHPAGLLKKHRLGLLLPLCCSPHLRPQSYCSQVSFLKKGLLSQLMALLWKKTREAPIRKANWPLPLLTTSSLWPASSKLWCKSAQGVFPSHFPKGRLVAPWESFEDHQGRTPARTQKI